MIGFEVFATLLLTRLVLPISVVLIVGEWVRRSERSF